MTPRPADARAALGDLARSIGTAGLAAARAVPGLLAEIDQHAAAVRDRLTDGVRHPGPVALAGYADGLRATATSLGWRAPAPHEVDWVRAPWPLLRLLAVCQLAEPRAAEPHAV
jgi:hypothetical protein